MGLGGLSGLGARSWGVSFAWALVSVCVFSLAVASTAGASIYWTNGAQAGTVGRANPDGTGVNQSFIGGALYPEGVAVYGAHIYWANGSTIARANLDGTGVRTLITGVNGAEGVAVDGSHVYWANYYGGSIGRANLDGTGVNQSFITGGYQIEGVAVDGAHVYWSNFTLNIGRANLDGTGVNQSFVNGGNGARGVAVDGSHIYWANYHSIGRANLDGTGVNPNFISVDSSFTLKGVAVDDRYVYWTATISGYVGRASLDGTGVNPSFITGGSLTSWVASMPGYGPTAMRLDCLSNAVPVGSGATGCTATLTDQAASPLTPTGTVTMTATGGSFTVGSCTLAPGSWVVGGVSASCNVAWTPPATAIAGNRYTLTASYSGDRSHASNSTSREILMIPPLTVRPPQLTPRLTNVTQSARRWREGNKLPHYASARPPVGTIFRFTLDKPAKVRFAFSHTVSGRRVGGECVAITKQNRGNAHCKMTMVVATLRHRGHVGSNSLHFEGRINRRKRLAPGTYTLEITANANGKQSRPHTLRFTILP
jgi:virginiamycin B lyase